MIDVFMTLVLTKGLHYSYIITLVICPKDNWLLLKKLGKIGK
jgi:hypothetical protein